MQHSQVKNLAAAAEIPAGYVHDSRGRTMEMDTAGIHTLLHLVLARICIDLVVDILHTRRLRAGPPTTHARSLELEAVRVQHLRLHLVLPVQY